jgi:hypothetical protein
MKSQNKAPFVRAFTRQRAFIKPASCPCQARSSAFVSSFATSPIFAVTKSTFGFTTLNKHVSLLTKINTSVASTNKGANNN